MSTLLLVRHGMTAMTSSVLVGRTPGVHLDERGQQQAAAVAERIAAVPLAAIVSSPLERCLDTANAIRARHKGVRVQRERRLIECGYGDWTGKPYKDLMKDPMWKVVQAQPSAARFPNGEALSDVSARAVAAVRDWDAKLGPDAVWVACSHGDVIKAIVADALGLHLDQFQRIVVDPCSVSVIRYTEQRPYVLRTNDTGGDLSPFAPPRKKPRGRRASEATVGGGAGAGSV